LDSGNSHYLQINRRVSLMASATGIKPIQDLFMRIPQVDAKAAKEILKFRHTRIDAFFSRIGHRPVSGKDFARALETMIDDQYVANLGKQNRDQMLDYLRATITNFDDCTDLIIVDIGYSASIQKLLREIFDIAGIKIKIHGCYLLTLDDELSDIAEGDSAMGFISDLVVTPHTKRALLRNILMIEQIFSAQAGSVLHYRNGKAEVEKDPRPVEQLELCKRIQDGALEAACLHDTYELDGSAPFNTDVAAAWCAAIIARVVLLPTQDELKLLSNFRHDINLGTQTLFPMIDAETIRHVEAATGLKGALVAPEPPMWLSGSLALQTRLHGLLYTMFATGNLPLSTLSDVKYSDLEIGLIAGQNAQQVKVPVYRTVTGRVVVRIPVRRSMAISAIAIPIGHLAGQGRVTGISVQGGASTSAAIAKGEIHALATRHLTWIDVDHESAAFFNAKPDASHLVVPIDTTQAQHDVVVTTIEFDLAGDTYTSQDGAAISRNSRETTVAA
jgi:hypothetical protein